MGSHTTIHYPAIYYPAVHYGVYAVDHMMQEVNDINRRYAKEIRRTDRHSHRIGIWLVDIIQN